MSTYRKNKAAWLGIIQERGMDSCSKCGYDKHFGAIDFHHIDQEDKNGVRMCFIFAAKPTPERIEELNKCIPLCATCHREYHIEEGTVGKHVKREKIEDEDIEQFCLDL